MKLRIIIIFLFVSWSVIAQAAGAKQSTPPAQSTPPDTNSVQNSHQGDQELSTKVDDLDSLGVTSTEVTEPYQGGMRRIKLENTVFRREEPVTYYAGGRRDPFRALIADEKKDGPIKTDLLLVDGANLTGIVWAEGHYLAMIKDKDGRSFFLREGDAVYSGRVTSVTESHVVIDIAAFGDYHQVTLKVND